MEIRTAWRYMRLVSRHQRILVSSFLSFMLGPTPMRLPDNTIQNTREWASERTRGSSASNSTPSRLCVPLLALRMSWAVLCDDVMWVMITTPPVPPVQFFWWVSGPTPYMNPTRFLWSGPQLRRIIENKHVFFSSSRYLSVQIVCSFEKINESDPFFFGWPRLWVWDSSPACP